MTMCDLFLANENVDEHDIYYFLACIIIASDKWFLIPSSLSMGTWGHIILGYSGKTK